MKNTFNDIQIGDIAFLFTYDSKKITKLEITHIEIVSDSNDNYVFVTFKQIDGGSDLVRFINVKDEKLFIRDTDEIITLDYELADMFRNLYYSGQNKIRNGIKMLLNID